MLKLKMVWYLSLSCYASCHFPVFSPLSNLIRKLTKNAGCIFSSMSLSLNASIYISKSVQFLRPIFQLQYIRKHVMILVYFTFIFVGCCYWQLISVCFLTCFASIVLFVTAELERWKSLAANFRFGERESSFVLLRTLWLFCCCVKQLTLINQYI